MTELIPKDKNLIKIGKKPISLYLYAALMQLERNPAIWLSAHESGMPIAERIIALLKASGINEGERIAFVENDIHLTKIKLYK